MFNLLKKNKGEVKGENNAFGSKNYQMKDMYEANDLFVAKFQYVSSEITDFGPKNITTEQKYFFEQIVIDEEIKYREVFTGFIAGTKTEYFDLPYVVEIEKYTDYFPDATDALIPKLCLMLEQNKINFSKQKKDAKVYNKK